MRRLKSLLLKLGTSSIAFLVIICFWFLLSEIIKMPFLPNPFLVFNRIMKRFSEGLLFFHIAASAFRVFVSLIFTIPLALVIGLAAGRSVLIDKFVSPFIYLLHPIPKIAFLPVIMLFLGIGNVANIFLISIIVFGQLLVTVRDSAKALPLSYLDSIRSMKCNSLQLFIHVLFPYILPALLSGIRVALGTAFAVLFIAENFATNSGLGYFIVDAWSRVDYLDMYSAIVALSLLSFLCFLAIDVFENIFCSWYQKI